MKTRNRDVHDGFEDSKLPPHLQPPPTLKILEERKRSSFRTNKDEANKREAEKLFRQRVELRLKLRSKMVDRSKEEQADRARRISERKERDKERKEHNEFIENWEERRFETTRQYLEATNAAMPSLCFARKPTSPLGYRIVDRIMAESAIRSKPNPESAARSQSTPLRRPPPSDGPCRPVTTVGGSTFFRRRGPQSGVASGDDFFFRGRGAGRFFRGDLESGFESPAPMRSGGRPSPVPESWDSTTPLMA